MRTAFQIALLVALALICVFLPTASAFEVRLHVQDGDGENICVGTSMFQAETFPDMATLWVFDWGDGKPPTILHDYWDIVYANHQYTEARECTVSVFACCGDGFDTDEKQIFVIGGMPGNQNTAKELRYYCGSPVPSEHKDTLSAAQSQPAGTTYEWFTAANLTVEAGQYTAVATIAGQNGTEYWRGEGIEWVTLVYYRGGCNCPFGDGGWTVYKPESLSFRNILHGSTPVGRGFESRIGYWVLNQFIDFTANDRVMDKVWLKEIFEGGDQHDPPYPNENWTFTMKQPFFTTDGSFDDKIAVWDTDQDPLDPRPQPPTSQDPQGPKVDHTSQTFIVGGTDSPGEGCAVRTHVLQRYINHGRHE